MEACQLALNVIDSTHSLYKEIINTAYLPDTETDVCRAGLIH